MKRAMVILVMAAAILVGGLGCGGSDDVSCEDLFVAACVRSLECEGEPADRDECAEIVALFGVCDDVVFSAGSDPEACLEALEDATCEEIEAEEDPEACEGIEINSDAAASAPLGGLRAVIGARR